MGEIASNNASNPGRRYPHPPYPGPVPPPFWLLALNGIDGQDGKQDPPFRKGDGLFFVVAILPFCFCLWSFISIRRQSVASECLPDAVPLHEGATYESNLRTPVSSFVLPFRQKGEP
jgi:hypothetical protein